MRNVKLIAAIVGVILIAIVILQNTDSVETKFLLMTVTMPRAALLAVTFLLGVGVGIAAAALFRRRSGTPNQSS